MFSIMQAWNEVMHFITNVVSKHSFCRSVLDSATISPLYTHTHTHTHVQSCWSHIPSDLWPLLRRSERTITVLIGNISGNYCPLPFFEELNRLLEILCSYNSCFILTHTRGSKNMQLKCISASYTLEFTMFGCLCLHTCCGGIWSDSEMLESYD